MAADKKGAARLKAALVFIDESGFLMAPLLRRTWAPRGATPILYQRGRTHQKVSAIAALCVNAARDQVACYFRLHPATNIDTALVVSFLRQLSAHLEGAPFVVVWDSLQAHRAAPVRAYLNSRPATKSVHLPPYAPELNPVEYLWSYLKTNPLANAAHAEISKLRGATRRHARSVQRNDQLLRSFIRHSPLFLRLK